MAEFIQIQWTTGSIEEARRVCRYLVQERLVACAQITPWVESVFMWDNQLQVEQETKVIFKTRKENYETVRDAITQNAKYEIPEILSFAITGGNQAYLEWMEESIAVPATAR